MSVDILECNLLLGIALYYLPHKAETHLRLRSEKLKEIALNRENNRISYNSALGEIQCEAQFFQNELNLI